MENTPYIKVMVSFLYRVFLDTDEGKIVEKSALEAFEDTIEQLKSNMKAYSLTFVDASLQNPIDINYALEEVYFLLPDQKRAVVYIKKGDNVTQAEFVRNETKSYIKFTPLRPYAVREYEGKRQDIDTAYYIDLSLKFTYNLFIHSFIADNF